MKRFLFSPILMATVLLMGSLTLLVIEAHSHDAAVLNVAENTDGLQEITTWHQTYSLGGTDSAKFDLSERKTSSSNQIGWQELKFKSANIPDYENPADANTDNDYVLTLTTTLANEQLHTHSITIRVTDLGVPGKMSTPTLEDQSSESSGILKVSWTASSYAYVTQYEVDWVNTKHSTDSGSGTVSGSQTQGIITGLTGGQNYTVKVRALSVEGNGAWSDTESITLTEEPLDPPDPADVDPPDPADAIPGLSSEEQLLLGGLLNYDTVIFNELHNASDDANDWLELRNVSSADLSLDDWQLTIRTGEGEVVVSFPAGTVIPAGEVLLLTNTEVATAEASVLSIVSETFALPQSDFALILRSPTALGDIAGNHYEGERPETAPALTVDTVWYRSMPTVSGYRADAWTESTYQDGIGTPGYRHSSEMADINNDGVVNILDLVLVASQFGTTGPSAVDLNGDNTVNIQDLVLVANALGDVAAAPSAKQPTAALVNTWVQLAQQNESVRWVERSETRHLPEGFSYDRGIQVLEQLARALTPETTALFANYPNPFNPETWIPYQLSKPADVTVTIYASDGSVVRTLVLGHQAAGMYKSQTHAAYWDGKNELGESVASGLYFYTLTAGEFTATRRMLILK